MPALAGKRVALIDGEMTSWYGVAGDRRTWYTCRASGTRSRTARTSRGPRAPQQGERASLRYAALCRDAARSVS